MNDTLENWALGLKLSVVRGFQPCFVGCLFDASKPSVADLSEHSFARNSSHTRFEILQLVNPGQKESPRVV